MNKYTFSIQNQSNWIVDIYNQYLPYKTNGNLVEIWVGHTIAGIDRFLPENLSNFERGGSNTADLLDIGWSGIYIEPVKEYCIEAEIAHKNNLNRLKIINVGASDEESELELFLGDSFIPNPFGTNGYEWIGRKIKTMKTSNILEENNCPMDIDIMSIDVEGFENKVIKGIDFTKHKPNIIIVEIDKISIVEIDNLLSKNYSYINSDSINAVWIKN